MYWLQRYPLIVFRLTLGCSLLSAWALAGAGPYGDLQQKLRHAHSDADVLRIVKDSPDAAIVRILAAPGETFQDGSVEKQLTYQGMFADLSANVIYQS